jgi:hypothetical protein
LKGNTVAKIGFQIIFKEGEAMKFIECMIERATDLAGSDAFVTVLIKVSFLYKYAGLFV